MDGSVRCPSTLVVTSSSLAASGGASCAPGVGPRDDCSINQKKIRIIKEKREKMEQS